MWAALQQLLPGGAGEAGPEAEVPRPAFLPPRLPLTPTARGGPTVCDPPPALSSLVAERPVPPNFSGRWLLSRVEGDYEALMRDLGHSWCDRRRARRRRFGVGAWVQQIRQEGDSLSIEGCEGSRLTAMALRIGGEASRAVGADRKEVSVSAQWDGSALLIKVERSDWARPLTFSRAFGEGGALVVKCTTLDGKVIRRYFVKQPSPCDISMIGMMVGAAPTPAASGGMPPAASASSSADASVAPAAFAGKWVLEHIEGDFEAFLLDAGASWAIRRLAKSMSYGVGKSMQTIRLEGQRVAIVSEGGPKVTTMEFQVGAGEQEVTGPDGSRVLVTPEWRGGALHMEIRRLDGSRLPPASRYIVDGQLVIDTSTSKGERVTRYFSRVAEPAAAAAAAAAGASFTSSALEAGAKEASEAGESTAPPGSETPPSSAGSAGGASDAGRPNFAGRWLMESYQGDCEALLVESGANWAKRKLAKTLNFGVGRFAQDIRQEGDDFYIVLTGGPKTVTNQFRVGAGEQRMLVPDGSELLATPQWQGGVLHVALRALDGKPMPCMDRSMVGDRMVLDSVTSQGELVRRFFVRQ